MRRSSWVVVLAFVVGACNFKSSLNSSSTTPSGGTSSASTSSDSSSGSTGDPNERIPMIDVMGKTPDEAIAALKAAGFSGEIEVNRHPVSCVDAKEVPGQINCQDPLPGKLHYRRSSVNVTVYETPRHEGRIIRDQMQKVIGMNIEAAKKYMKSIGHDGELEIVEDNYHFHKGCAKDTICDTDSPSGTGVHDRIILWINKKTADITMPD